MNDLSWALLLVMTSDVKGGYKSGESGVGARSGEAKAYGY